MPRFHVFPIEEFDREFNRLELSEQHRVEKIVLQLAEQGDVIGRPLSGRSFFREKRVNGKRLYYLVFVEFSAIWLVRITDKKSQQRTIDETVWLLQDYREQIIHKMKSMGLI